MVMKLKHLVASPQQKPKGQLKNILEQDMKKEMVEEMEVQEG